MLTFCGCGLFCVMRDRATHMAYSCKHRKHLEMYNRTIDFQLQHTSMLFPFNELNYDNDEKKISALFCSFFVLFIVFRGPITTSLSSRSLVDPPRGGLESTNKEV